MVPEPRSRPFFVADERGYYAEEDLAIEFWEPEEHYDTLEALADGELDFAITEPIHLVPDRAAGVPVQGIATFLHTQGGIQYPTDRGWESPADMPPGVRLNYPGAPGEGGRKMVAYMAQQAGGDLTADDIEPVDQGFYHTDALLDGAADAAFLAFHNFEIVESRHRGFDAGLWELAEYGVPDFNRLVLTASDEKIEAVPEQVQRFVRATRRGVADTVDAGREAAEALFERHPEIRAEDPELMEKITEATLSRFTPDLTQDRAMYEELIEFCAELELSQGPVDVDDVLAEEFA
ncbi:ABC transporter, substrate-binding protein, aliphatic sulfonates family [Halolamina pelagica]|uniref:Thiamine pyrimidine synthase n=1 Tax=Halolamina pelagica TaxID=699431 RepID=A0A0P7H7U2_9EURY|nr:ABC transporter substrate-binding protein [Halolamina pelagica]KPN29490.1 ABC transporter, substrate-binding protein, aliphatic sulfonates family [Halolamina pelagica]